MTDNKIQPIVSELVEGGRWSLTAHFGKGDEARDAMRALADAIRGDHLTTERTE
jgi:hypothetical protein